MKYALDACNLKSGCNLPPFPGSPARASESSSRTPSPFPPYLRHRSSPCLSKSPATCSGESTLSFAPLSFLLSDSTRARLPWTLRLSFYPVFFHHPLLRPAVYRTTIHVRHTARRNLLQLLKSLCNTPAVPALLPPLPPPAPLHRALSVASKYALCPPTFISLTGKI